MSTIRNVLVAGASNKSIGSAVINALLSAGFTVSVLSREASTSSVPYSEKVNVIKTDYTPLSLQSALKGQDAVVSCVGYPGIMAQLDLIDAAEAVGVQRFIPSEFGDDTLKGEWIEDLHSFLSGKQRVMRHLMEVAQKNEKLSWSALANGPFIDLALFQAGLGFDHTKRSARIFDSGNESFTGTKLATVGQSVVLILQNLVETRNKFLRIRSIRTTQNALLAAFEAQTNEKWAVTHVNTTDLLVSARERVKQGDRSGFHDLLAIQFFQDGCGRGMVAQSEEDGEEGMKILRPEMVNEDELVKNVLSRKVE